MFVESFTAIGIWPDKKNGASFWVLNYYLIKFAQFVKILNSENVEHVIRHKNDILIFSRILRFEICTFAEITNFDKFC